MRTSKDNFKFLFLGLISFLLISSCSYQKTNLDIGSLFDPTWDFSKTSELTFDENYVEIKNGKVQLKALDLEHSGDDFNNGSHVGSHRFDSKMSILKRTQANASDLQVILPELVPQLIAYWRFDSDLRDISVSNLHPNPTGNPEYSNNSISEGKSINFNGSSQPVTFGDNLDMVGTSFSISGWVYPRSFTDFAPVITKLATFGSFRVLIFSDGKIEFGIRDSSNTFQRFFSNSSLPLNAWTHVRIMEVV